MSGRDPPELIVKFWPPSVTAKGPVAINAVKRPLAFAVYARPVVMVVLGIALIWGGHECARWLLRLLFFGL